MNGDPVEPRLQAALAIETLHATKNLEENFLSGIRGISRIGQDAIDKAVDRLVVVGHKPVVSLFRTRFQLGNDGGFLSPDSDRSGDISQCCYSRHLSHGVTPI